MRNPSIIFLLYLRFSRYVTASTTMKPSRYLTNIWSLRLSRQKRENEENQQKNYRKEKGIQRENSQEVLNNSKPNKWNKQSPKNQKRHTTNSIWPKCYQQKQLLKKISSFNNTTNRSMMIDHGILVTPWLNSEEFGDHEQETYKQQIILE